MGLTSIPMINNVIQEFGLPKIVCDLLAQACMASGVEEQGGAKGGWGDGEEGKGVGWHGRCSVHMLAVGLPIKVVSFLMLARKVWKP